MTGARRFTRGCKAAAYDKLRYLGARPKPTRSSTPGGAVDGVPKRLDQRGFDHCDNRRCPSAEGCDKRRIAGAHSPSPRMRDRYIYMHRFECVNVSRQQMSRQGLSVVSARRATIPNIWL
jgi:hypothetical protein